MTAKEYIQQQIKKIPALEKAFYIAVSTAHADQVARVFERGEMPDGGKIGSYDTRKPLYVNPATAPKKFTPKGKNGESAFQNGKKHKTGYFPSYAAFRRAQGRQTSHVDLKLSGQLQSDYANSLSQTASRTWVAGTKNKANTRKVEGMQDKYGDIFKLGKKEREKLIDVATKERLKIRI